MLTKSRSKTITKRRSLGFVICINNDGYEVSLERLKLYRALYDADARQNQQIRVIDESGDDYIYPARMFATVDLLKLSVAPRARPSNTR